MCCSCSQSKDATERFKNNLAGDDDLNANYQRLADACGTRFQLDYFGLLEADGQRHPQRHLTADVSELDMYNEYLRLTKADHAFASAGEQGVRKGGDDGAGDQALDWAMGHIKDSTAGKIS